MAEKDITRIKVGKHTMSIIGIKLLMEEIASTHGDKSDEEVRNTMLEWLGKHNYISSGARDEYGKAFVREFRKFLGQPYTEESSGQLDVKVLGMGCSQCHSLTQTIMEILTEIGVPASVDHVTDIKEIGKYNVRGFPALVVNDKVLAVGSVPPRDRIKAWLVDAGSTIARKG